MRAKVEALDNFSEIEAGGDGLGLLRCSKSISFQFQSSKWVSHSLHEALKRYYNVQQGKFATTQAYLEHFNNVVDVVIHSGGEIAKHPGVENDIIEERGLIRATITEDEWGNIHTEVQNRSTAMVFLLGSDRTRYGKLIEDLENAYLQGHNNYLQRPCLPYAPYSPTGSRITVTGGSHQPQTESRSPTTANKPRRSAPERHILYATSVTTRDTMPLHVPNSLVLPP